MSKSKRQDQETVKKAHCPTCDREQNCELHGYVDKPWYWEDREGHSMAGGQQYSLFECRGCETVFTEISAWDENHIEQWYDHLNEVQSEPIFEKTTLPPPPARARPDWLDKVGKLSPSLFKILDETYSCFDEKCFVLTAIGLRTALDSSFAIVEIDQGETFGTKLKQLLERGFIGETEHQTLSVLVDAGSAAAHRAWSPDEEQTTHLLDALENFVQRVLVNGKKALDMRSGIPKPQRRRKNKRNSPS